jgi:hypothetical protein
LNSGSGMEFPNAKHTIDMVEILEQWFRDEGTNLLYFFGFSGLSEKNYGKTESLSPINLALIPLHGDP